MNRHQPANGIGMGLFETNTHSFVIKIWLEEIAEDAGRALWRGHVTHIPNGARRYVQDLDGIVFFIVPYLEGMGGRPGLYWRLKRWLNRARSHLLPRFYR